MTGTSVTAGSGTSGRGEIRFGRLPATVALQIREPGSAITHFAGLILVMTGAGPLLMRAELFGNTTTVVSMLVFLLTSSALYAASTVYHTVVLEEKKTRIFKKLDHMMISVMIAGTYTPVCLCVLKEGTGAILLASIWTMAVGGIILKAFWVTCPKWISSFLYLAMGWLCIFALPSIWAHFSLNAFLWLLAGGILYSAGAVIYALRGNAFNRKHPYFGTHEIFHVFIMAGTFCHYMVMYRYVVFF